MNPDPKASGHALLAANGMFHSSVKEQLDQKIEKNLIEKNSLSSELSSTAKDLDKLNDRELEDRLIALRDIQIRSQTLTDWFDEKDAEHLKGVEKRGQEAVARARNP